MSNPLLGTSYTEGAYGPNFGVGQTGSFSSMTTPFTGTVSNVSQDMTYAGGWPGYTGAGSAYANINYGAMTGIVNSMSGLNSYPTGYYGSTYGGSLGTLYGSTYGGSTYGGYGGSLGTLYGSTYGGSTYGVYGGGAYGGSLGSLYGGGYNPASTYGGYYGGGVYGGYYGGGVYGSGYPTTSPAGYLYSSGAGYPTTQPTKSPYIY
jgi:hypothetical protein